MPQTVITSDHLEYAVQENDKKLNKRFGDLAWEQEIMKNHESFWSWLVDYLTRVDHATNMRVRDLLTRVFAPVYKARRHTFPRLSIQHIKAIQTLYGQLGDYNEDKMAVLTVTILDQMKMFNELWAYNFSEDIEFTKLSPASLQFVLLSCGTLMVRIADEAHEPPARRLLDESPQPPPLPKTPPATRDLNISKPKEEATMVRPFQSTVTFADVGGCHEAKGKLAVLARRINNPGVAKRWGAESVRGVLLRGPKGTGKTTLAQAFAHEVNLPFFRFMLSDVLHWAVNSSPERLAEIFTQVKTARGGLLFFDEADAILVRRGDPNTHHEDEKLVNEWNICMDRLTDEDRILVMLATNFTEKLDEAAIRDGRIDMVINVPMPANDQERVEVFKACMGRAASRAGQAIFKQNIDLAQLARRADGLAPAAIENVIRIALNKKESDDLAGLQPGLVTTADLSEAIRVRRAERENRARQPIGFATMIQAPAADDVRVEPTIAIGRKR